MGGEAERDREGGGGDREKGGCGGCDVVGVVHVIHSCVAVC